MFDLNAFALRLRVVRGYGVSGEHVQVESGEFVADIVPVIPFNNQFPYSFQISVPIAHEIPTTQLT